MAVYFYIAMEIKDTQGNILFDVPVTQSAVLTEELMKQYGITLGWNAVTADVLPVGAYIEHNGVRYSLLEPYSPTQKDEVTYEYIPVFHHPVMRWGKLPMFLYSGATQELDWSLTGNPANFMSAVCQAITNQTGEVWSFEMASDLPASASLSFSNTDIFSGLNSIADAFKTEWWFDYTNKVVYLSKAGFGSVVTLEVGKNIGIPSRTQSKEGYATRFYGFGSTRNIDQSYEGANVNSVVNRRLTLNPAKYPNGYIDIRSILTDSEVLVKTLVFDDIYPRSSLTISDVKVRLMWRLDDNNQKVQVGTDSDGNPVYDQYAIWYFKIPDFIFSKDLLIKGKSLSVHFNSGSLSGREFELTYHDKGETLSNSDGTDFVVEAGDYEINFVEEGTFIIPAITGLVPVAGNSITLFNIIMPEEYKASAYAELEEAVLKEIAKQEEDQSNYTFESNKVAFYESNPNLSIGRLVTYKNGAQSISTRVIKLETQLDYPFEQRITVGNAIIKGSQQTLKEEVVNANQNIDLLAAINESTEAFQQALQRTQKLMQENMAADLLERVNVGTEEEPVYSVIPKPYKGQPVGICSDTFITAGGRNGNSSGQGSATTLGGLANVDDTADNMLTEDVVLFKGVNATHWTLRALSTLGINEEKLQTYLETNKYVTQTFLTDNKYLTKQAADELYMPISEILWERVNVGTEDNPQWAVIPVDYNGNPVGIVSDTFITSGGRKGGSGTGSSFNRLDSWDNYNPNAGDVLSAVLGYDLKTRLDNLNVGLDENKLKEYLDTNEYITKTAGNELYAPLASFNELNTKFNDFLTGSDIDNTINKWKELEAFLAGQTETSTLADLLAVKADKTALQAHIDNYNYFVGTTYAAHISAYNTHIADYNTFKTDTQQRLVALEALWGKDDANKGLYPKNGYGIYSESYITAGGVGTSGGGSGTGGGLIQNVYGYADLGGTFNNNILTDTFNAYTINTLATRIGNLENGTTLPDLSGKYLPLSGGTLTNSLVVSAGTISNVITSTRRSMFYKNASKSVDYGTYITDVSDSGTAILRLTYDSLTWKNNTVIHSGNIGSQQVEASTYASSLAAVINISTQEALDNCLIPNRLQYGHVRQVAPEPIQGKDGIILAIPWNSMAYGAQIIIDDQANNAILRTKSYGTWNEWRTFAFLNSNVASATKLQTARTIWGQSFDGTGNITGVLQLYGKINVAADIYLDNQTYAGLNIRTSSYSCMLIGNKVGIGITDPAYKLDVAGTLNATTIYQNGQTLDNYYLPLSGGTLTNSLVVSAGTISNVITSTRRSMFYKNASASVDYGTYITDVSDSGTAILRLTYDSLTWKNNIVIHSGNVAPVIKQGSSVYQTRISVGGVDSADYTVTYSSLAAIAWKLSDDTAYTAWGQTFFENGVPTSVTGKPRFVYTAANSSTITESASAIVLGSNGSGMSYNSGISFNGLATYGSGTYSAHSHAWIGLGPCINTNTAELYPLVFATNGSVTINATLTERMRITPSGFVGIGTTTPAYKLDVAGTLRATDRIYANECIQIEGQRGLFFPSTGFGTNVSLYINPNDISTYGGFAVYGKKADYHGIHIGNTKAGITLMHTGAYGGLYRESAGKWLFFANDYNEITIGDAKSSSTGYQLWVAGSTYVDGNIVATGAITAGSDARYKTRLQDVAVNLETIANAPLFNFKWNNREDDRIHLGTTAQYWAQTDFRNAVIPTTDEKLWTMSYSQIAMGNTIVLARELLPIKRKVSEIDNLKNRLHKAEKKIEILEQELNQYRRA